MESIELSAKTLDEARALAAQQLGVVADQVHIEVLEEVKGLFGKVTLKVRASAGDASAAPAAAEEPKKGRAPARGKKTEAPAPVAEAAPEPEPAPAEEAKPARGARTKKVSATPAAAEAPAAESNGDEEEAPSHEYTATDADAQLLLKAAQEILDASELTAHVELQSVQGRYVNLKIDGKDLAYLVGKNGEVLNSLQYLLNVIGNKSLNTQARVTLDGNDYRVRREEALSKYATSIAEQVKEKGMEAVLDALPAFERRIVHKALQEIDGISTYSEGEEPNRRVVIAPA